ncbi:unnamed protein product [Malus baccata var. baccata]
MLKLKHCARKYGRKQESQNFNFEPSSHCPRHLKTPRSIVFLLHFFAADLLHLVPKGYRKARNSTQFKLRTATKLKDYLESAQLSHVSAKLSRAKKVPEMATRSQMKEVRDFEWLINKLKVLMDLDKETMNLKDDSEVEACTPFQPYLWSNQLA